LRRKERVQGGKSGGMDAVIIHKKYIFHGSKVRERAGQSKRSLVIAITDLGINTMIGLKERASWHTINNKFQWTQRQCIQYRHCLCLLI